MAGRLPGVLPDAPRRESAPGGHVFPVDDSNQGRTYSPKTPVLRPEQMRTTPPKAVTESSLSNLRIEGFLADREED